MDWFCELMPPCLWSEINYWWFISCFCAVVSYESKPKQLTQYNILNIIPCSFLDSLSIAIVQRLTNTFFSYPSSKTNRFPYKWLMAFVGVIWTLLNNSFILNKWTTKNWYINNYPFTFNVFLLHLISSSVQLWKLENMLHFYITQKINPTLAFSIPLTFFW